MRRKKEKKDRRIKLSTFKFVTAAAVIGVFILVFSFSYAWGKYDEQMEERASTDVFKTIELEDFEGNTVTRKDIEGTTLVAFNVWETTCPACLKEMGDLEKLYKEYDPSVFKLYGMCADLNDANGNLKAGQVEKAKNLMKDAGVTFPNLIPDHGFSEMFEATIMGFPTTFFVDSEGKIVNVTTGARGLEEWKDYVDAELEKIEHESEEEAAI